MCFAEFTLESVFKKVTIVLDKKIFTGSEKVFKYFS